MSCRCLLGLLLVITIAGCGDSAAPPARSTSGRGTVSGSGTEKVAGNESSTGAIPFTVDLTELPTDPVPPAETGADQPTDTEAAKTPQTPAKWQPIYDSKADAQQMIDAAVAKAKVDHKHVLIKWGGNWCSWCYKLHDVFKNDETVHPILFEEYELVLVDSNSNMQLLQTYGGKDRRFSYPHLTVLDATGKVLTNQETGSLEIGDKHDPQKVAEFLKKWTPERADAEGLLAAALKQAADEDKSVFMQFGTPYCGWCTQLSRFIAEHQQTFDRDYVYLKIDYIRMTSGQQVAARFQPEKSLGDPWMVILDPRGKVQATSIGPKGNIGCPYQPEEIEHFLSMLRTTKKRLTDSDLTAIGDALTAARQANERKDPEPEAKSL